MCPLLRVPKPDPGETHAPGSVSSGGVGKKTGPGVRATAEALQARREILGKAALGAGAGAALLAAWPLAASLFARPDAPTADECPFLDVAAETEITAEPTRVILRASMRDGWLTMLRELGAAWLVRTPGGIEALSAICPHLGCGVERYGTGYFCPCHDSKFDALGARKSGPAPRGLDRLSVRIVGGRVQVQPRAMGQAVEPK